MYRYGKIFICSSVHHPCPQVKPGISRGNTPHVIPEFFYRGSIFFEKLDSCSWIMVEDKFRGNDILIIPPESLASDVNA